MPELVDADEDRRRSTRFICGGDAKISLLPSDGIFLAGKILDLSLHGCRIDTTLAINIDNGVRTEIVVRVNDASFRAVGEVRAVRGASGVGIEFVRLSASGKDTLSDLIKELAKLQAIMNKLRSARRETDAESFRMQLADGRLQAGKLSKRFAALGTFLSAESSRESLGERSKPNQPASTAASANEERVEEAQPLVIAVDLFG
jgi:hypothetical protein